MRIWKAIGAAILAMLASTHTLASDDYPNRPITLILPMPAGGNADTSSRLVAHLVSEKLRQTVVLFNKPGAGGILGMEAGATAKPDGYTMLFTAGAAMAVHPWLHKKLPYDPAKSFTAIRAGALSPFMMVVNPSKPYKTLPEFIDYAKKHSNAVNYGSPGIGSPGHLAGELLQQLTGIKMTHVPYNKTPALQMDLLSGVLDIGFELPVGMKSYIAAGEVLPIAIAGDGRMKNFPNVPTFAELGYPDMKIATWGVFLVPAGTPASIVRKLDAALAAALKAPAVTEYYSAGDAIILDIGSDKFPAFLASESAKMKLLLERSGTKVE